VPNCRIQVEAQTRSALAHQRALRPESALNRGDIDRPHLNRLRNRYRGGHTRRLPGQPALRDLAHEAV
jgi:hypothetical protein